MNLSNHVELISSPSEHLISMTLSSGVSKERIVPHPRSTNLSAVDEVTQAILPLEFSSQTLSIQI